MISRLLRWFGFAVSGGFAAAGLVLVFWALTETKDSAEVEATLKAAAPFLLCGVIGAAAFLTPKPRYPEGRAL